MTEKEILIEELNSRFAILPSELDDLVTFILADRSRIVQPLVKVPSMSFDDSLKGDNDKLHAWYEAIRETLRRSGIED